MSGRPPERAELDVLLGPLLTFAQDMLKKHGEFYPFGDVMTNQGKVELFAAYEGSERPPSKDLIDLLAAGMRSQAAAGTIKAAGLCFDVRIKGGDGQPTDAIAASLEHKAGDSVLVFMPYSKGRLGGFKFGELTGAPPVPRRVFVTE